MNEANDDIEAGKGTYGQCSGGSLCNAANGCSSCDHSTGFDWLDVNFENPHPNPVVLSQIQSHTGGDWVKTRQRSITSNGFQVKQEEDGLDIGHNMEDVAIGRPREAGGDDMVD